MAEGRHFEFSRLSYLSIGDFELEVKLEPAPPGRRTAESFEIER